MAIIAMAFFQAIGIASVVTLITLIMDPEMIFDNYWLNMIYQTLNFQDIRPFIVFVGISMVFKKLSQMLFRPWLPGLVLSSG